MRIKTQQFSENNKLLNPSIHNVEKRPNILKKSCGMNTAKKNLSMLVHISTLYLKGLRRGQPKFLLHEQSAELIRVGQSAKLIIIFFSLRAGTSKNKNIGHRGKEICAYKSDQIFLYCDSTMSSVLNFCF